MAAPLDQSTVFKYGRAGARRRQFRQALGIGDIRKVNASQRRALKFGAGGSGMFSGPVLLPSHRDMLARRALGRRKSTTSGGMKRGGGPAGGKPVL